IQCTPDLQPTDVTGLSIYNQRERDFEFRPGPIFANVVLVDEINRAMPKTQSALLEAMAENQVTVDGQTRVLPDPFLLIATENPIEYEGTFPLPEAQPDRFFLKTALGYPSSNEELQIVDEQRHGHPLRRLQPVVSVEDVHAMRKAVTNVYVDVILQRWIVELVRATRELDEVAVGASVRGSLALERATRAWALLDHRPFVVPEDVERLFAAVLLPPIVLRPTCPARAPRGGRGRGEVLRRGAAARGRAATGAASARAPSGRPANRVVVLDRGHLPAGAPPTVRRASLRRDDERSARRRLGRRGIASLPSG